MKRPCFAVAAQISTEFSRRSAAQVDAQKRTLKEVLLDEHRWSVYEEEPNKERRRKAPIHIEILAHG